MEKMESALDVLSRAATMVQPCPPYPASDSDGFETPSTASSGESEGDRTLSPETPQPKELTGKWRRDKRSARLPEYRSRENGKMALRSQSFNERRGQSSGSRYQHTHSDGELSDGADDVLMINAEASSSEIQSRGISGEAPIDMRLHSRPAPPPYSRPSVITRSSDTPPGSMSMCDPVVDEHFRRSLGDNYMNLFQKSAENSQPGPKPNTKDRASSPILFNQPPPKKEIIAIVVDDANVSVDDHFTKALGDTWKQIKTSRIKPDNKDDQGVDDHFSKALGDTWKKLQCSKQNLEAKSSGPEKSQGSKIISRSGVVI